MPPVARTGTVNKSLTRRRHARWAGAAVGPRARCPGAAFARASSRRIGDNRRNKTRSTKREDVMHRMVTVACALALSCALVPHARAGDEPIALRGMGSFHIGGRVVEITGKPIKEVAFTPGGVPAKIDMNGVFQAEQMYVQYFLPQNGKGKVPLLMWHGGGLTGVTYETTPDGREGWVNMFVRKGWDVYNSDAVERGRAGFAPPDVWSGEPMFLTFQDPFERFRIGEGAGSWNADPAKRKVLSGSQFPVEAYENYMKQQVPRWIITDDAIMAGYLALVDKICPCVVLAHSQGGAFSFKVAEQRPDKVKAVIAIEPA